jgi:hypothetical protein
MNLKNPPKAVSGMIMPAATTAKLLISKGKLGLLL